LCEVGASESGLLSCLPRSSEERPLLSGVDLFNLTAQAIRLLAKHQRATSARKGAETTTDHPLRK
jgi:hypothetical protein